MQMSRVFQCNVLLRLQERKLQAKEMEMFDSWNKENNSRLLEASMTSFACWHIHFMYIAFVY